MSTPARGPGAPVVVVHMPVFAPDLRSLFGVVLWGRPAELDGAIMSEAIMSRNFGKKRPKWSTLKNSKDGKLLSWSTSRPRKAYTACSSVRGGLKVLVPRIKSSRPAGFASNAWKALRADVCAFSMRVLNSSMVIIAEVGSNSTGISVVVVRVVMLVVVVLSVVVRVVVLVVRVVVVVVAVVIVVVVKVVVVGTLLECVEEGR
mmetsp:Transcript_6911/g.19225  ORF Transcript_6911/g.19225 Transcript_6911/m.19225 type:complete len:203 (+) Transcript_6911:453-1061(+)